MKLNAVQIINRFFIAGSSIENIAKDAKRSPRFIEEIIRAYCIGVATGKRVRR